MYLNLKHTCRLNITLRCQAAIDIPGMVVVGAGDAGMGGWGMGDWGGGSIALHVSLSAWSGV